jgi:hypothetical protein
MTPQTETAQRSHHRAVRFFWGFLIGATLVSLIGNIVHAVWHLIPVVAIQIATAAVPPLFLLAVVHGIALSVRAGASGTVYRCAVTATAVIGVGVFVMSFRALRDLLIQVGTPPAWAWLFPAVIDTAIGVSTMMLVALGDKPVRRAPRASTQTASAQSAAQTPVRTAKAQVRPSAPTGAQAQASAWLQHDATQDVQDSAQIEATQVNAEVAQVDTDLALELIASGATTQPIKTVIAVLAASRDGSRRAAAARPVPRCTAAAKEQHLQRSASGQDQHLPRADHATRCRRRRSSRPRGQTRRAPRDRASLRDQ